MDNLLKAHSWLRVAGRRGGPRRECCPPCARGKATIERRRPTGRRPSAAEGCPAPGGDAAGPRPPELAEEKRARFTSTRPATSGAGAQDCCWRPRQLDDRNKITRSDSKASCHKRHAPATTAWPVYRCCPAREPARFERASAMQALQAGHVHKVGDHYIADHQRGRTV